MNDYSDLDAKIVKLIRDGKTRFEQLVIATGHSPFLFRIVDRRLQVLRKRGEIHFSKGEWHLTVRG